MTAMTSEISTNVPKKVGLESYCALIVTIASIYLETRFFLNSSTYAAGLTNQQQFSPIMKDGISGLAGILLWLPLMLFAIIWMILKRKKRRILSAGIFAAAIVIPPIFGTFAFIFRSQPSKVYMAGLSRWTVAEVDAPMVRKWIATSPASPATQPGLAPSWPPSIAKLTPDSVDLMPGQSGVILTWGDTAEFSSRREIFVGVDDQASAPTVIKWGDEWQDGGTEAWHQAAPGVWISVQ
jgi:hypothetical protein